MLTDYIKMLKKIILPLFVILSLSACKRDFFDESGPGELQFSADTIIFDTLFTSVGSTTQTLKVYNRNNNSVTISSIYLANLNSEGVYRINVDGFPGTNTENVKIAANDSIYIFVEATINPVGSNLPYLVTDSLIFVTNGKTQNVDLVAYGQNANFYTPHDNFFMSGSDTVNYKYYSISENTTWNNTLPHVIYGYVIVEPNATLTINEGCKIYFHKNSGIIVGNPLLDNNGGTLKIKGELNNEVVFQGDRQDNWYENLAGQWDRIWFSSGSIENEVNYAIIRNGTVGLHVDTIGNNNPTLTVKNTIIENMSDIGIFAQGSHVVGENNVISNCGRYAMVLNIGGTYDIKHSTFANYWSFSSRNTPSILLNNYYKDVNGNIQLRDLHEANFTNCIISGSLPGEIDLQENNAAIFNYSFNNCLLKLHPDSSLASLEENNSIKIQNSDSLFVDIQEGNYQLHKLSPAIDAGVDAGVSVDILGITRNGNPDLGAYEKID